MTLKHIRQFVISAIVMLITGVSSCKEDIDTSAR